jgi:hypothetical protein
LAEVKTYYVSHDGVESFNCDLFVNSESPREAYDAWLEYCDENEWPYDKKAPVCVWPVDSAGSSVGAVDWSDMISYSYSI